MRMDDGRTRCLLGIECSTTGLGALIKATGGFTQKRSLADKTTYREAAFDIAVERVTRAVELRGFV